MPSIPGTMESARIPLGLLPHVGHYLALGTGAHLPSFLSWGTYLGLQGCRSVGVCLLRLHTLSDSVPLPSYLGL